MAAREYRTIPFLIIVAIGSAVAVGLCALGFWQLERLEWKRDLIARVESRVDAEPVPLESVQGMQADSIEYRRVRVTGRYDFTRTQLVQAATELGYGYWVMTPLQTESGDWVTINRGFVAPEDRDTLQMDGVSEHLEVVGLVRHSEPGGGFLRGNDPVRGRWYSRDVQTLAKEMDVETAGSIFIDAEEAEDIPTGGLTVVKFRNSHLVYAFTWFILAGMTLAAVIYFLCDFRRRRE